MTQFKTEDGTKAATLAELVILEIRAIRPALPAVWDPGQSFRDDLGIDSLDLVELVARLEQATGIFVPDPDLAKLTSVSETLRYINARQAEIAPPDRVRVA